MRLYSGPLSMFGAKVEIAAYEKGLDFELVMVPFNNKDGYSPKHLDVVRVNPKQQVPILIDGDLEIFDSTQIFEYLEDLKPSPALWPADPIARAHARQIEHKSDEVYFPHIIWLMGLQDSPNDPVAIASRIGAARFYREMEDALGKGDFLGGTYSYADIAFYMAQLFGARMGAEMTEETPKLIQWRIRMTSKPAVRKVVSPMVAYLISTGRQIPVFLNEFVPAK
nr:glutathione S-transferase family protein [Solimicrobium silvestre]